MRYSVLSFDLDGTLVDTASEIAEAANRTLAEFGVARQPEALVATFIGGGMRETLIKLMAHLMLAEPALADRLRPDEALQRVEVHYNTTAGTTAKPYPGAEQMLDELRASGLRLACLTNKEKRFARRVLKATGLWDRFDLIVGGDSLPQKKPHRSTLEHVLGVLGGEAHRAAHIGDSHIDIQTARNAGVEAWAVPWGYNAGRPIAEENPQRIFDSLGAISAHVLQANRLYQDASIGSP